MPLRPKPVLTALVLGTLAAAPRPALAAEAEARAVALSANCPPGKISPVRQVVGGSGETIYKVDCAAPKGAFVLVQCRGRQCVLLR